MVRAEPGAFALRFLLGFAGATLIWILLAPAYAAGMAAAANVLVPVLEADDSTRYESVGGKVVAFRKFEVDGRAITGRQGLWTSAITWNTSLFAAAILATPGWSWSRRGRALALGIGILAASHFLNVLVNILYTQAYPPIGGVPDPGWSAVFLEWLSRLFDMMAAGFLPIVVYVLLVAGGSGPGGFSASTHASVKVGPNARCPCGSGLKFKNCCRT